LLIFICDSPSLYLSIIYEIRYLKTMMPVLKS
jgi:hypothetical protein